MTNSFAARAVCSRGPKVHDFRLSSLEKTISEVATLPSRSRYSGNLLRTEDGKNVRAEDIERLARGARTPEPNGKSRFTPSRILLQDFTGVPAWWTSPQARRHEADGRRPAAHQPTRARRAVIDHSVQVDALAAGLHSARTPDMEFAPQSRALCLSPLETESVSNLPVVRRTPASFTRSISSTSLASSSRTKALSASAGVPRHAGGHRFAHDHDQMDSECWLGGRRHRGGGRHAGPASGRCSFPRSWGSSLKAAPGRRDRHRSGTDRDRDSCQKGSSGIVEFHGEGLASLSLADRATIANMAPEYGRDLRHLSDRRRDQSLLAVFRPARLRSSSSWSVRQGAGLFPLGDTPAARYSRLASWIWQR